jgi:hypothetical protein
MFGFSLRELARPSLRLGLAVAAVAAVTALVLGRMSACSEERSAPSRSASDADVGLEVEEAALARAVEARRAQLVTAPPGARAELTERLRETEARRLADDELVRKRADALGVELDPAAVDAAWAAFAARFRSEAALAEHLRRSGRTESLIRADLERNLRLDALVEAELGPIEVPDAAVEARLEQERTPARARVLALTVERSDGDLDSAQERARRIRARALRPGADFEALARREGAETSGARAPEWVPLAALGPDAEALQPEQITPPIASPEGVTLYRILEIDRAADATDGARRAQIEADLRERARLRRRSELLRRLRAGE